MPITIKIALMVVGLSLGSCAWVADRQYQEITDYSNIARNNAKICAGKANLQHFTNRLRKKIVLNVNDYKKSLLNNKNTASDSDIEDIKEFHKFVQKCRRQKLEDLSQVHSGFVAIQAAAYRFADKRFADLIGRKITFAEANRDYLDEAERFRAQWKRINTEIVDAYSTVQFSFDTDLRSQIPFDETAPVALKAWTAQQKQHPIYDAPKIVDCYYVGNSLSCVSYKLASSSK